MVFRKNHIVSKEIRKKISYGIKNSEKYKEWNNNRKPHSKETREKQSESAKKRYKDPKQRELMRQKALVAYNNKQKRMNHKNGCKNNRLTPEALLKAQEATIDRLHFPYNDTKIELKVRSLLDSLHIKYTPHYKLYNKIMGWHEVDIMILDENNKPKIAIECDGCYWHGCLKHFPERKRERDNLINKGLKHEGIEIHRFWECEINSVEWQLTL